MDNEPEEVIKHQMLETRASLTEKLETLEQQVVGTVQTATSAVTDTVQSVKEAVQETVEMAKTSVYDTVEAVKDSFDVARHVRERPWTMMAGSVAVGFVGGYLMNRAGSTANRKYPAGALSLSSLAARSEPQRNGGASQPRSDEPSPARADSGLAPKSLLTDLGQTFDSEIHKLKGLALGAMLGTVRDVIASSAPPQLGPQLAEIIDSATVKLGGQPIQGPVLEMFRQDPAYGRSSAHSQSACPID
jgi:ElaB/YqjD/DUF883 family membrane-anchored ribosome-binding protein